MRALAILVVLSAFGCEKKTREAPPPEKVETTRKARPEPVREADPTPAPLPMGTSGESKQQSYTTGHVLIKESGVSYEITGAMIVNIDDHWAKIDKGGEDVWFVPRERVVYIGQKLK